MSNIDISHSHSLSMKKARAVAEDLAEQLAQQYDLDYEWDANTLNFHRSGVSGNINVTKDSIDIKAKLGWLLAAMRGMIETEIHRVLGKHFE